MKKLAKLIMDRLVQNDSFWRVLNSTFVRAAKYAELSRTKVERDEADRHCRVEHVRLKFSDLTVRHGPFKGMRYPESGSSDGCLFPRILGSYEQELHPLIEKLCRTPYTEIVDVGCAEGYYAVGFAMRIPQAIVYAFDIDPNAVRLCERMGAINGVKERVILGSFCDAQRIATIPIRKRGLVFSDCEGHEKALFTREAVSRLRECDFLIEVHDFIDLEISSYLRAVFDPTHRIETVNSVDDIRKAKSYQFEELAEYDLQTRRKLLAEGRPAAMEWFFASPKSRQHGQTARRRQEM